MNKTRTNALMMRRLTEMMVRQNTTRKMTEMKARPNGLAFLSSDSDSVHYQSSTRINPRELQSSESVNECYIRGSPCCLRFSLIEIVKLLRATSLQCASPRVGLVIFAFGRTTGPAPREGRSQRPSAFVKSAAKVQNQRLGLQGPFRVRVNE